MANISLTLYTNGFFGLVLKSPTQMGSLSINNSVTNISRLGTFKTFAEHCKSISSIRIQLNPNPGTLVNRNPDPSTEPIIRKNLRLKKNIKSIRYVPFLDFHEELPNSFFLWAIFAFLDPDPHQRKVKKLWVDALL
jgi:hypothetical protein